MSDLGPTRWQLQTAPARLHGRLGELPPVAHLTWQELRLLECALRHAFPGESWLLGQPDERGHSLFIGTPDAGLASAFHDLLSAGSWAASAPEPVGSFGWELFVFKRVEVGTDLTLMRVKQVLREIGRQVRERRLYPVDHDGFLMEVLSFEKRGPGYILWGRGDPLRLSPKRCGRPTQDPALRALLCEALERESNYLRAMRFALAELEGRFPGSTHWSVTRKDEWRVELPLVTVGPPEVDWRPDYVLPEDYYAF